MSTYRLWPSTNGPATPINYTGNFISGTVFTVSQGNCWFEGYWWWVAGSGQSTAPVKCALWSFLTSNTGAVVPGSVVTSGTLTAGQWNYIPLSSPVQLAPGYSPNNSTYGSGYIAAIGVNGSFPDTNNYWGAAQVAPNGITNGPLFAYSANNGGAVPPYNPLSQSVFTTAGTDPSVTMPLTASNTDNFWVDVQISNVAPVGYSGTYRIWPNKYDTNDATGTDSAVAYVIGMEVDLSSSAQLNYIHYYVPGNSNAAGLATKADLWSINTGLAVASISSPSWKTESGGSVTLGASGQWVKAAFPGGTIVPAGKYRVSVYNANGANGAWGAKDASTNFWYQGVGVNGITWGPLTAPSQASAQSATFYPSSGTGSTGGQPVFAYSGNDDFPSFTTGLNPAQNYWVDLEVTPIAAAPSSGLLMTFTP